MSKQADNMDEYDKKFAEMQKYIPFLEAMIERLQKVTDKSREIQLQKMQQLHGVLTSNKRKLKIETLQKCEDVLQKLHSKVDKGTSGSLNFPSKKSEDTPSTSNASETVQVEKDKSKDSSTSKAPNISKSKRKMDETPASPSPPGSPVHGSKSTATPIIIPTERRHDYVDKPASPDTPHIVPQKEPIVIPTERKDINEDASRSDSSRQVSHEKTGSNNNLPVKPIDSRPHKRHIPTIPVPSPGSRRYAPLSEKSRSSNITITDTDKETNKTDATKSIRLPSSDGFVTQKNNSSSLLVSPPPSAGPPLSMEDLAELLNDGSSTDKRSKTSSESRYSERDRSRSKDKFTEENRKSEKDKHTSKTSILSKEHNPDVDSERRWEEIDKHIVKLTARKGLPSTTTIPVLSPRENSSNYQNSPSSHHSSGPMSLHNKKTIDTRNLPQSPVPKTSERAGVESRLADNYERHPRQPREQQHNDNSNIPMPDMNVIKSAFSRLSEGDIANLVQTNLHIQTESFIHPDERSQLYRRSGTPHPLLDIQQQRGGPPEQDYRRENTDFYNMHQDPMYHQGGPGFVSPQWGGANPNTRGHPNVPQLSPRQAYQHQQDGWNMGPNQMPMDHSSNYPAHHIPNQFAPNHNMNDQDFSDDIHISPPALNPPPLIPPLMSSQIPFPNPQYRSAFPPDNRPYEPPFERPGTFPHVPPRQEQWDLSQNRVDPPRRPSQWDVLPNQVTDPQFERNVEYPHVATRQSQWDVSPNQVNDPQFERHAPTRPSQWEVPPSRSNEPNFHNGSPRSRGMDATYSRQTNADQSWHRGSNTSEPPTRSRGNERFPNERGRSGDSPHSDYNRRGQWDRPNDRSSQNESTSRFGNRDPRFRAEQSNRRSNSPTTSAPRRDPRLSKDSPLNATSTKTKEPPSNSKTKDIPSVSKRDPRRRNSDSKESNKSCSSNITHNNNTSSHRGNKNVDKPKDITKHNSGNIRRNSLDNKLTTDKPNKDSDKMQSPLESLYGAIDTSTKTGKGYGLQKFKIPKIKRPELKIPRPPTPPRPSRRVSVPDENWDNDLISPPVRIPTPERSMERTSFDKSVKSTDDKKIEVSSTTEETDSTVEKVPPISKVSEAESTNKGTTNKFSDKKNDVKFEESEATVDTSTPAKNFELKTDSTLDTQVTDTVTQELIESLIKKSLESGEGKKLLEQAKLLQKLGEALHAKKYKKIKKIINSDSDSASSASSDSIKEVTPEKRKVLTKKKRRVIISDSSDDDESLADRIAYPSKKDKAQNKNTKNLQSIEAEEKSRVEVIDLENKEEEDHDDKIVGAEPEDEKVIEEIDAPVKESTTAPRKRKRKRKARGKKSEEVVIEEPEVVKDEEIVKRPSRVAKKRRNSLEMLQEDIREMFISEGVVTATGHRMCRLLKEAGNKSIDDDKTSVSSSSPERHKESYSENESTSRKARARSKSKTRKNSEPCDDNESVKSRGKTRKSRKCASKTSKNYVMSSDTEEQTLSRQTDTENAEIAIKDKPASPSLDGEESTRLLRRSGRVALKLPRLVIEKTDLSRIDSGKMMFDTSSDESFGIDVSELTAAVDISLHSERQAVDDNEPIKKVPKRVTKSKKKNDANEMRKPTPISFDDDISMASDVSISSSNASSVKKITSTSISADTNEDFLSNLLDEIGNDEKPGVNAAPKPKVNKKKRTKKQKNPQGKKKRRTNQWQLGIVPKSKKKKSGVNATANDASTLTPEEVNDMKPNEMIEVESKPIVLNETIDSGLITKDIQNSPKKVAADGSLEKEVKEVPVSPRKLLNEIPVTPYPNLDANELIEYAWTGLEKYNCMLCTFSGKHIVHHYKTIHPQNEIMISRLAMLDAKRAIDEAQDETFIKLSEKANTGPRRKFSCRFCVFTIEGEKPSAMEAFYEHCTTHTGEYRFTCKNCGFQTVAKSSMKPHYYKMCRKSYDSHSMALMEDQIPVDEYIPGYLCSLCNFLQLKESNLKRHIQNLHTNINDVEIIKINMSSYFDVKDNIDLDDSMDEDSDDVSTEIEERDDKKRRGNSNVVNDSAKVDTTEGTAENVAKKLSVFVCPPEVENKEQEIQLERKKKMQEILNNFGTNFQKDSSNKGLSIIDKLKDKMQTVEAEPEVDKSTSVEIEPEESKTTATDDATTDPIDPPSIDEANSVTNNEDEVTENTNPPAISESPLPVITSVVSEATAELDKIHETNDDSSADKSEKKLKDPLASLQDGSQKDDSSDEGVSDTEPMTDISKPYESYSTEDEISDTEMPADVHSLLKDAETINTSSTNVPMMTTIQRLAAQLQGVKTVASANTENSEEKLDESSKESTDAPESSQIMMECSTLRDYVEAQGGCTTPSQSDEQTSKSLSTAGDEVPKNFIRLRRLSGDKLSIPDKQCTPTGSRSETPISSVDDQSEMAGEVLQTDTEEECSFLKIENVISLAENPADNDSVLVNDIRKAVEISPAKSGGISILKKPTLNPNIVLRPIKTLDGLSTCLPAIVPAPKKSVIVSTVSGSPSRKKMKLMRPRLQVKDTSPNSYTPKLKNADAYAMMLSKAKVAHLYKCMGRACTFTTDRMDEFKKHYKQHTETQDTSVQSPPYDYQKCAYCSDSLLSWDEMQKHFKAKHTFCAFQCVYCFYRAFTQSYVELHQSMAHPGKLVSVILGIRDFCPPDSIDRREYTQPFVCKHQCNKIFYVPEAFIAHLKKHDPTLSLYKCHMCPVTTYSAEELIKHYKGHGIFKFQCLYCLFGADSKTELHYHLSAHHCNRPSKILERTLPPSPIRDKDVLLQLLIPDVDESFKCTPLKIINDSSTTDLQPSHAQKNKRLGNYVHQTCNDETIPRKTVTILPKPMRLARTEVIDIEADRVYNVSQNIIVYPGPKEAAKASTFDNAALSLVSLVDKPKDSTKGINVRISDKPLTPSANEMNIDNVKAKTKQPTQEPEMEVRYVDETTKLNDDNQVDPLSIADTINCTDEFISINVLDNPEILKSAEQSATMKEQDKNNKTADNDDDDSDIEILEHIQHTNDRTRSESVPITTEAPTKAVEKIESESIEEESMLFKDLEDEKPVVCSSGENSSTPFELSNVSESIETLETNQNSSMLLTLEDIKNTGLTGKDLYKCCYSECIHSASNANILREHIKMCPFAKGKKDFPCVHCNKKFAKPGVLLEHLKLHGLKRFGCSLCDMRFCVPIQTVIHMKTKHKSVNSKLMPADPTNPSADGLFVVYPLKGSPKKGGKKVSKMKSFDKDPEFEEKLSFSPAEIDVLPRQAIYNREVQCAVCPYTTKVRTNIIRHLQLHLKDESVPESGPVNPVPCLDKKERMFDKMVNLASSSHQNGRMGGGGPKETVTASEIESLPKYVQEQQRYVCGVTDCNYLTMDESMLRYHMKALHPDEIYFPCPHCPTPAPGHENQGIIIEKLGVHLKMHDTKLYKCSHCNHHHYHRHVVERHLMDKHTDKRPFVKVIREIENTENPPQPIVPEEVEDGPADRDGNYWKCNICDYRCVYKSEMLAHTTSIHNEKSQFKCSLCSVKTNAKVSLEQHFSSKHPEKYEFDFTLVFERMKGPKKTTTEVTDQAAILEPFDTTPLWRRDMPRIRHIRGILLEDEAETRVTDSPGKSNKRKSDTELMTKPMKIKLKSASLDDSLVSESKLKSESEVIDSAAGITTPLAGKRSSNQATVDAGSTEGRVPATVVTMGRRKSSDEKFGAFGAPNGTSYVCTLCTNYKTKFQKDIRNHLYKELKYWRWHCKACGFMSITEAQILKHASKSHKGNAEVVAIAVNPEIESWVQKLLSTQWKMMRKKVNSYQQIVPKSNESIAEYREIGRCSPPTITLEDSDNFVIPLSTISISEAGETTKTVDLAAAISSMKNLANTSLDSDEDDDGDGALVIDSKDDIDDTEPVEKEEDLEEEEAVPEQLEQPLVCKHCSTKFSRWRGFKLHVQVNHLKRLDFLCPYCDRSTNSELLMHQHIRAKHVGLESKIIKNPTPGGPELSDAFWEKEYGLIRPKKVKKVKRKPGSTEKEVTEDPDRIEKLANSFVCRVCNFSAINSAGLHAHMRAHTNKQANKHRLKCVHCSFTTNSKSEVWQHSEINHQNLEWKAEEINTPGSSQGQPAQYIKMRNDEDYSKDIEEETMPETIGPKFLFGCFYCHIRSSSLDAIKKHWATVHQHHNEASKFKTGVPFQCKEIPVVPSSSQTLMKCAYCPKKAALQHLRTHCRKKHPHKPPKFTEAIDRRQDIWECKWCNESVEASARTSHHTMFHSHLPTRFRRQQEMQIMQKGYVCPECGCTTISLSRMRSHVTKHYDTYRCKRCNESYSSIALATQHSIREHPGSAASLEGIATNIDAIMAKVSQCDFAGILGPNGEDDAPAAPPTTDIFRNLGVAKKSTTKQITRPLTSTIRSVARKSTHPLPRYPPGIKFKVDEYDDDTDDGEIIGYSYYGLNRAPVDLANLNTTMAVGGVQMTVKCNTLAQIINIDPCVVLRDIKNDKEHAAVFSSL